jgi:hypothetical protein
VFAASRLILTPPAVSLLVLNKSPRIEQVTCHHRWQPPHRTGAFTHTALPSLALVERVDGVEKRGLEGIFIACVDGLKGLPQAINSAYPKATVHRALGQSENLLCAGQMPALW